MTIKLHLYEKHKVKEYWIVHPTDRVVTVYKLIDGKYGRPAIYTSQEDGVSMVRVGIFDELIIDLNEVFFDTNTNTNTNTNTTT